VDRKIHGSLTTDDASPSDLPLTGSEKKIPEKLEKSARKFDWANPAT
jgi:hypothetical protein